MSIRTVPAKPSTKPEEAALAERQARRRLLGLRVFDAALLVAFLALTFLLGAFPLKDTDFWWHLRTGDLIRQTGVIPTTDTYTYTSAGRPWIDLHWLFQVAISWIYQHGGVPALTLAKCAVTTLAVLLLVTARRREWPIWASVVAWLPALLVLGGRMYVRPETLTLLYLSIYLAVLTRIDRWPWLAFVLPVVQVAWVNTQGLFVFGPILLGFALIDALLRPGAFAPGRGRWWKIMGGATLAIALACFVNPYGFRGALYPLELAGTMRNPVFSKNIAELTPIPEFILRDGLVALPFRLHLLTIAIGALSFLVPMAWVVVQWARPVRPDVVSDEPSGRRSKAKPKAAKTSKKKPATTPKAEPQWRLSVFRFLLFAAFTALSWQATRNSHQFAAVVGSVTAWNFAEWAAAVRRTNEERRGEIEGPARDRQVLPRVVALVAVGLVFAWVASGRFYEAAKEGRTIGLGEQPLWYPHEAVKFSGEPGMPERFLSYHIGHASIYEYYFAPERKVYVDARLEVIGPDLFERYMDLQQGITLDKPGWARELDEMGRPVILVNLENNSAVAAVLMTNPSWKCVWFDPIAAVFVHESYSKLVAAHEVNFLARHFQPDPRFDPKGSAALLAVTKGLNKLASLVMKSPAQVKPLVLLGSDYARRLREADPRQPDGWKQSGLLEMPRDPDMEPVARFRMPFDPVFDLSLVRATYALRRAADLAPHDFTTQLFLSRAFKLRGMSEAELTPLDRLVEVTPINAIQRQNQAMAEESRQSIRSELGAPPPSRWENLTDLARIVNDLLAKGRAETAADYLEQAEPADTRSWAETDRIATLRLHLGQAERARMLWQNAAAPPNPVLRESRIGFARMAEGALNEARESFRAAIALDPKQFDAYYGLALLELDLGHASEALAAAESAAKLAPHDTARSTVQELIRLVRPYAQVPVLATEQER